MSGRIKLLKNGVPINSSDDPQLGYLYDAPSSVDQTCGTYGLKDYQLPNSQCPDTFVCGVDQVTDPTLLAYIDCLNAMNCKMLDGMTSGNMANSPIALFIHQMIPHHQNAVNMAKAFLVARQNYTKTNGTTYCSDITNENDPTCFMEVLMRSIINSQNAQIQDMRGVLAAKGYPAEDNNCQLNVQSSTVV